MNENESDVVFKIENKTIPVHKKVLIRKCQFFANLFNSGMSETRQDVIEIGDCDSLIFQEFLRFLYCDEIPKEVDQVIKLFNIADKYLQNDLTERCMDFLKYNIILDNVYTILDFAQKEDISPLKAWCMQFLRNNLNTKNLSGLIKYLDSTTSSRVYT